MKIGIRLHIKPDQKFADEAKRLITHFVEQVNQNRINPDEYTWEKIEHDCRQFNDGSISIDQFRSRITKSYQNVAGIAA